jgi:Fe2+ transport system protein FeoA
MRDYETSNKTRGILISEDIVVRIDRMLLILGMRPGDEIKTVRLSQIQSPKSGNRAHSLLYS